MTTYQIKSELLKKINTLGKTKLNKLKGYIENLEQNDVELIDWVKLSASHKNRIEESIEQVKNNKFQTHDKVIKALKKRIDNA